MNILPIILVSFGILFLCYSCLPASQICTRTKNKGWKVLLGLIGFFIFAYSVFLFYLIFQQSLSSVNLGISGILCSGSIFVVVVINYSLQSIRQLHQIATTERYNALHDSLTLLPNRVYCLEQLNQKISLNQPFSVITFDLHNFKQINDAMGHYCGDELLVQLSQRFKDILTEHYFLSRMGSDEFVVLCPQHSNSDIRKIIDKVESTLDKPFNIHGHWIMSSMSAGISIFPTDSQSADKLLQHSDIAMYKAKKMGQSFMLYHPMMDNDVKQKLTISNYLKPALSNKEFRLFYQPLINTKSSLTHGYEALIRWPQKDGSFIPPDLFIPIAEQSNIIKQLTHWDVDSSIRGLKSI
ncbi:diguanylate cyclase domain-containing protein [Aliivibrio wodanis]|uniref:diguanylate cyclase domain-containing protein n=1 Tax=Aliivibrio wodanis TaxID=80852 RepID=UPI00406BF456